MSKKVSEKIKQAVEDYKQIRQVLNQEIRIGGKTLVELKDKFFMLDIPNDMDHLECRKLMCKLIKLYQEASLNMTMATVRYIGLEETVETIYREEYNALLMNSQEENTRPLAAPKLEAIAKHATSNVRQVYMIAKIEKEFWKNIILHLQQLRKKLEQVNMSNALELKHMPGKFDPELPEGTDSQDEDLPWEMR